jgi:hypothetical protein
MAVKKGVTAWPKGADPLTPEERAAKREQGQLLIAALKKDAGRHKDIARRERKVQKLNTMGPDATYEKKRMRVENYGGQKPTAGLSYSPKGNNAAR